MIAHTPVKKFPRLTFNEIDYPESDGKPMAETDSHITLIAYLLAMLRSFFANRDVYIGGNMLMYYEEGDPTQCVAPDLFVALNTTTEKRRSWFVWKEKKAPDVIFEFTSKSTRQQDRGAKKGLYALLGVKEYFLFDPLEEYLDPCLQGFRLVNDSYQPIPLVNGVLQSEMLGLTLKAEEDMLTLTNTKTGKRLLPPMELSRAYNAAESEIERLKAEVARLKNERE